MKFGGAALLLLLLGRCCCTSPGRKVCQGMSNQLTLLSSRDNHYDNMVRMYTGCAVVLENLEITYTLEHQDLSFLQSIQEVGGYVLIAMNEAAELPLVNLRLIRGQNLYEGQFALLVLSNYHRNLTSLNYTRGLRHLQLSNLTEILRGGVKITHNPLLCNTETIQWADIVDTSSNPTILFKTDTSMRTCEKCDPACVNGSCWAAGPDHCQKFTKLQCAKQCSQRCRGPKPIDCCNDHCAAGCTGPLATDCLVSVCGGIMILFPVGQCSGPRQGRFEPPRAGRSRSDEVQVKPGKSGPEQRWPPCRYLLALCKEGAKISPIRAQPSCSGDVIHVPPADMVGEEFMKYRGPHPL